MMVTVQEVLACSLPSWYPVLAHCSLPTRFIELDEEFLQYLHADGVILPDALEDDADANKDQDIQAPSFPELQNWISCAISELNGEVIPKLNWSAPKDAVWITPTGSIKCATAEDVLLLLKSSDHIAYDLSHPFDVCADYEQAPKDFRYFLCLRQWYDFHASMEFRCFVKDHFLIGISQRDHTNFYPFLLKKQDELLSLLVQFFYSNLHHSFGLPQYTFDVIVTSSMRSARLVDINPFGTMTEPLLFDWQELIDMSPDVEGGLLTTQEVRDSSTIAEMAAVVDFRLVTSQAGIRASTTYSSRVPKDVYDLASGQGIEEFVKRFRDGQLQPEQSDSDDNDDDNDSNR